MRKAAALWLIGLVAAFSAEAQKVIFEDGFESGDFSAWSSVFIDLPDSNPPLLEIVSPIEALVINQPQPEIVLAYSDPEPGVDLASLRVTLDGQDITAFCNAKAATATCLPPALDSGFYTLAVEIADGDGNRATAAFDFELLLDTQAPEITIASPAEGALLALPVVLVSGLVTDGDQVTRLEIAGQAGALTGDDFVVPAALTAGLNQVEVVAIDRAGNQSSASLAISLDLTPPSLTLDSPLADSTTNQEAAQVVGFAADELGLAGVTVNGAPATLVDGRFAETIALPEGLSTVIVKATDLAGNGSQASLEVRRLTVPEVTITGPADRTFVAAASVDVTGVVSSDSAAVTVNGVDATVTTGTFTALDVPIAAGGNLLVARATAPSGAGSSDKVTVFRDASAPRVTIDEPSDGAVVDQATIAVTGLVQDLVLGTVNGDQVTVTVNGVNANVANRSYLASAVPLVAGENLLTVTATDSSGNVGTAVATVFFQATVGPRLDKVSGDLQQAVIGQPLPQPLVVELRDAAGAPVAGRPVVFQILGNNGSLAGGERRVVVDSGADGRAATTFTLGSRAGVGSQRVLATAPSFLGQATFLASAQPGAAARLVVDDGDQQTGTAGRLLPDAFAAVVTDDGFNRLAGVDVRFRVVAGGGTFAGGTSELVVASDSDGRASARLRLDPGEGIANNVVEADLPDSATVPFVTFVASGKTAGDPAATRVSGIVLDNSDQPVPGATLSIRGTALSAQANDDGLFEIAGAPVGTFLLDVEGATTSRPGQWPHLEFEMSTIAGRDNTLGMPVYLLPLEDRGLAVSATEGGVLTLPELPGFALEVAPGSVTFPGGGDSGIVSATLVHGDKVPMVPNFGQQPKFIVTIQPAGAVFDPPARLVLPNVDALAPGEVTEMYSFDHDLASFVSIGPGTVTEDATRVVSNPGVGIVKAGWHCGGNPASSGTPHDCPTCKICNGSTCVPGCSAFGDGTFPASDDELLASLAAGGCNCTGNDPCEFDYRCDGNGNCISTDVEVNGISGGACVVAVGEAVTFTAQSNKPDRVKWRSGGSPSTATGGSYSVTFNAEGDQTVTAFCKTSKSKQVTVGASCSGITPVLETPQIAQTPPNTSFGRVSHAIRQAASYKGCVDSSKWCFRLEKYTETRSYGVHSLGRTDISSANDSDVTAATCTLVIQDLTPPGPGAARGPRRSAYWSSAITTAHEDAHVANAKTRLTDKVFNDLQTFVANASNCTNCKSATPTARFNAEMRRLRGVHGMAFLNGEEARAHGVSNPMYANLISQIRARGRAENWPAACQ